MLAKPLWQEQRKEKMSIFSQQFQNEFFRVQMKTLFQMTSSFKGNSSISILDFSSPFSSGLFSLFPFLISPCQQESPRTPHQDLFPSLPRRAVPTRPGPEALLPPPTAGPPLGRAAEPDAGLARPRHCALRAALPEGWCQEVWCQGGTGYTLPSWLCLLPGVQRRFN